MTYLLQSLYFSIFENHCQYSVPAKVQWLFQTLVLPMFELSLVPMNNYGHALKLFLCSATIAVWSGQFYQVILLHTIDMYTRIGGVSLLNQTIPTNFSIISTLNWWSVSMRGVFLSTTRVLFLAPFQLENRLAPSFVYLWHTLNIYWRAVGVFLTSKSALTVGKPR